MNERRQRAARACVAGLVTLGALALVSACEIRNSQQGVQTAIAVAQTAIPMAQTILPGVQATAEAGATTVTGVVSGVQSIATQLQALLGGASVELKTLPAGAANDAVTDASLTATDAHGTLAQLDAPSRQAAATAAVSVMARYYPNASISLTVLDSSGARVMSGRAAPGQTPSVQVQ